MKNIIEFSDKKDVASQAAQWVLRLEREGGLTAQERLELTTWLERNPSGFEHLERLANVWSGANMLTELAVSLPTKESLSARFLSFLKSFKYKRAVAMVLVLIAIGIASVYEVSDPSRMNGVIQTKIGNQKTVELTDGSILKLNTQTELRVDYTKETRDVFLLSGEAHFTVTKDADRPFRVYAGNGRIHAIGTAFSVYLKDGTVDVTVNEGRVGIASIGDSLDNDASDRKQTTTETAVTSLGMLRAGEAGVIVSRVDDSSNKVHTFDQLDEITNIEVAKRIAWTNGILIFSGEPLDDVVKEISRYTNVNIEFSDPALKQIRIGGNFPVGETDVMFSSLETSFGLQVTRLSKDRVMISSIKKLY